MNTRNENENSSGGASDGDPSSPSGSSGPSTQSVKAEDSKGSPQERAERLEREIDEIRNNLGGLVTELDHRRHRLNPVAVARRYPWPIAIGGVVAIGATLGVIAWRSSRARRSHSWVGRAQRLREALGRAVDKPDKVAEGQPSVGAKILTAAGTAATAVVVRRLAARLLSRPS